MPTLDEALLCCSRAGSDLGCVSGNSERLTPYSVDIRDHNKFKFISGYNCLEWDSNEGFFSGTF